MDQSIDSLWNFFEKICGLTKPSYSLTCSLFSSLPGRLRDEKESNIMAALTCPALPCPVKCVGTWPSRKTALKAGRPAGVSPSASQQRRRAQTVESGNTSRNKGYLQTSKRASERASEKETETETEEHIKLRLRIGLWRFSLLRTCPNYSISSPFFPL
jgi:hypothetical protein